MPIQGLQIVSLYLIFALVLMTLLTVNVILGRFKHKALLGDSKTDDLQRRVRAHGNAAETMPYSLISMVVLALMNAPTLALHVIGGCMVIGRIFHAWGILGFGKPNVPRVVGMVFTFTSWGFAATFLINALLNAT